MQSFDIINSYYNGVVNLVGDIIMILYGSTAYGVKTSDLDVCFVCDNNLSTENFEKLKNYTHEFHKEKCLRIDEEIPYDNKMIYTHEFITDTFNNSPFPYNNGKYVIPDIIKSKEFLCSLQMKKRLLLNILTVKNKVIGSAAEKEIIEDYTNKAWDIILKTVISYSEKSILTFDEIYQLLYSNPFNGNSGEMYLGYKDNLKEKLEFIRTKLTKQLTKLIYENKIEKTLSKKYIPNERWLNNEKYN